MQWTHIHSSISVQTVPITIMVVTGCLYVLFTAMALWNRWNRRHPHHHLHFKTKVVKMCNNSPKFTWQESGFKPSSAVAESKFLTLHHTAFIWKTEPKSAIGSPRQEQLTPSWGMRDDFLQEVIFELSFEELEFGQQSWRTKKVNIDVLSSFFHVLLGSAYQAGLPLALHGVACTAKPWGARPLETREAYHQCSLALWFFSSGELAFIIWKCKALFYS